jgi:hypothetical protein
MEVFSPAAQSESEEYVLKKGRTSVSTVLATTLAVSRTVSSGALSARKNEYRRPGESGKNCNAQLTVVVAFLFASP